MGQVSFLTLRLHGTIPAATGRELAAGLRPRLPPEAEFWQAGWFNYEVQDEAELTRLLAYVRGNARQAGLPASRSGRM
ncbi:hypothetical protein KB206_18170 [Microvirga sp. STS02]|uniref:hypothetical protein n=1 Tax=Hymenobacter negativus TaxID=2795026 RepID=UPI0018DE2461|nr:MULTISPECIES: hypothetical protein [Bacteria]MBH8570826.1 hypothetical protein [Hymenobacter negativus]MBR7210563.1 hypothetical protein [Microvirga sp. STS02]